MKVEIDFIGAEATLTFAQLKELIDEASMKGYEAGVKDQKAKDRLKKEQEVSNVSRPVITKVPPKPPKCVVPDNNKELLEKFLGGKIINDQEADLIRTNLGEDQYRRGFNDGVKAFKEGNAKNFNPKIHIDKSVYGWAAREEINNMNNAKGHATILRNKNEWKKGTDVVFVKVTPVEDKK